MANYFIDAQNGDDANSGADWANAWRTLDNVSFSSPNYFFIASGIYTFEGLIESLVGSYIAYLIGCGHVIFRHTSPYVMRTNNYYSEIRWHNIHFDVGFFLMDVADATGHRFTHCGLPVGTILVDSVTRIQLDEMFWSYCSFEHALPYDVTNNVTTTSDCGPFVFTAGSSVRNETPMLWKNNALSCAITDLGFVVTTSPNTGAVGASARKMQADIIGASFQDSTDDATYLADGVLKSNWETGDAFYKFNLWKTDPATAANGTIVYAEDDHMRLQAGDNVAALSPVYFYDRGISLRAVMLEGLEFSCGNEFQGMDSTPLTTTRTMEFRFSNTEFFQTDNVVPWVSYNRDTNLAEGVAKGKYFQMRVTFNLQAVV